MCLIASGGHTLLAHVHRARRLRGARAHARRRRRARRSTRARGCSASATRAARRSSAWRADGDPQAFAFPGSRGRARARRARRARQAFAQGLDFSFAGLKTALLYTLRELSAEERRRARADLAASYQAAIVDSLIARAERALERDRPAIASRSAAAWPPTASCASACASSASTLHVPARVLCTDNAAMIASAARFGRAAARTRDYLALDAYATGEAAAVSVVTVYTTPDCHLCERGDRGAATAAGRARLRAASSATSPPTRRCTARISSASRSSRSTARSCSSTSSTRRSCASV